MLWLYLMDEIIKAITENKEVERKVTDYLALSFDERMVLFGRLQQVKTETLGTFLNIVYSKEADKSILKIIRKLVFKLKSAGIKVDEPRVVGDSVLKKVEEVRRHRGFMSNYDETLTRLVVLGLEARKNAYILLNAEINFIEGLKELISAPVDKRVFERTLSGYGKEAKPPMTFAEISPSYALYLIEEGSQKSGRFRNEVNSTKSIPMSTGDEVKKPEDIYVLGFPDTSEVVGLREIMEQEIFKPFSLSWVLSEEDKRRYSDSAASLIVLPRGVVEGKKEEFLKNLVESGSLRVILPLVKRMAEDYAYLLHSTGLIGHYRGLVDYLKKEGSAVELLSRLVRKTLERGDNEEKEKGLIINPYG